MMRKSPWLVFGLIFLWKIALLVISAQPIPANDAFFYDGAAVHKLLYGGFYNPTLAQAFPICGTKIFSAYPPLYQIPLLAWMSVFGVSAKSVMALHLVLFGGYMLVLLAIFKRLKTPAWCANLAGGFLLAFTFHDRPDSLAHLFGALAIYAWIRSRKILSGDELGTASNNSWAWWMVIFEFLTLCTSLQIGGIYLIVIFIGTAAACHFGKEKFPFTPFALLALVPIMLVAMVKFAFPLAWAGFVEHARQTPSLTGFRVPAIPELLKIARAVPGILLVIVFLPLSWFKQHEDYKLNSGRRNELVLLPLILAAAGVTAASLCILTANIVAIANYLQPLVVATYLTICAELFPRRPWLRLQVACLSFAILLGAIRAIGMTTWGLACAADVSYSKSAQIIDAELANHAEGYNVVMSSAFLYNAAKHKGINFIHSDWLEKAGGDSQASDLRGLFRLKPQKIILTQFDYYRRFEAVLAEAKKNPALQEVQVINTAKTRAPDSYPSLQKVLQHVSWAPVIINLTWRE
jgi:hypothetical protein